MEQLTRLICGTKAFESLWKQFSADKFSHAYLVTGRDPVYLQKFLTYASAMALCPKGGCFSCITCNKVFDGNHVDVHVYPKKDKILTADANEIIDGCYVKPFEGERKVYILNNSDALSAVVQNKLLKTLEEPPENTIFFLGAVNENAILATVKSRCQLIHVDDTSSEEVLKYLTACGISESDAEIAAGFCANRPLLAEQYANDKSFYKAFDAVVDVVKNLNSSKDALKSCSKLMSAGEPQLVYQMLLLLYRETLMLYTNEDMLLLKHKKNDILCIKQKYSPTALYKVIDLLTAAKIKTESNCNPAAVIDLLVMSILEVKYICRK